MKNLLDGITRPRHGAYEPGTHGRDFRNPPPEAPAVAGVDHLAAGSKHSPVVLQNRVRAHLIGPDGELKQDTGWVEGNICNTYGLAFLASIIGSSAGVNASTLVSSMRIGTSTTAETSTDAGLNASTAVVNITAASLTKTSSVAQVVEYQATFASSNPAGAAAINEVGLFCNSTGNNSLLAHKTLGTASVNKGASDSINISYQVNLTTA